MYVSLRWFDLSSSSSSWSSFKEIPCNSGTSSHSPITEYQISGFVLISLGALLLADGERVLLSRLLGPGDATPEQPLFYYLAFAIVAVGFLMSITGLLGCWVSCLYNHCVTATVRLFDIFRKIIRLRFPNLVIHFLIFLFLHLISQYIVLIVLLLLGECTVCVLAVFWPHILGVDVRTTRLVRALQRSYALPGREQFTAALDLAQTSVSSLSNSRMSVEGTMSLQANQIPFSLS